MRQGDPLSPCSFVISKLIKRAMARGEFKGLKIKRCPVLPNLFFADDAIYFDEAREDNCTGILRCIDQFCRATRQLVNFDKSCILFSKNVNRDEQETFARLFKVNLVANVGSYSRFPTEWGESKASWYGLMQEKMLQKTDSCKAKFLSVEGKEVLLKSVAQALLSYLMSIYKLPKKCTSDL